MIVRTLAPRPAGALCLMMGHQTPIRVTVLHEDAEPDVPVFGHNKTGEVLIKVRIEDGTDVGAFCMVAADEFTEIAN